MKTKSSSPKKGQFGYLKVQKKKEIGKTILFFAISLAIFLMGYLSTGKKENLLTIIAVLGMLPASKSAVSMILYLKTKNFSEEIYQKIAPFTEHKTALFELVLTSYDKNFAISSFVIADTAIVGYTEWEQCDVNAAQKHIASMIKKNGYQNVSVKIFHDIAQFKNRVAELSSQEKVKTSEETPSTEEYLAALLKQISL